MSFRSPSEEPDDLGIDISPEVRLRIELAILLEIQWVILEGRSRVDLLVSCRGEKKYVTFNVPSKVEIFHIEVLPSRELLVHANCTLTPVDKKIPYKQIIPVSYLCVMEGAEQE